MRIRSNQMLDILESQSEAWLNNIEAMLEPDRVYGYAFDSMASFLVHSIMNVKQFEKFYWPLINKAFDMLVKKNKNCIINMEADVIRFSDFFNDYPKGTLAMLPEMEDVRDIRKAMPNIAITGGMQISYLGYKSPEECVDLAKETIDTMGEGFALAFNKMLTYRNDCKRENLLAVSEFIHNYRV